MSNFTFALTLQDSEAGGKEIEGRDKRPGWTVPERKKERINEELNLTVSKISGI